MPGMIIGQATVDPVTGMAGRLWTKRLALDPSIAAVAVRPKIAADCEAIASAFIEEMQANGQAVIAADTSADGLQNGTTHPTSEKTLPLR